MQNYIMVTQKYLLFYAHINSRVETIITIFCLQFEGENKLNNYYIMSAILQPITPSK
jgi:hypothetical protein